MTTAALPIFLTPWLLVGAAAAAIPVVLHLLSSVRAPEMHFPTLRFLRISMDKTARRRRLEHWLLLILRSLLLALLAIAVAEPVLRTAEGFWSDRRFAAVVILDNSYSMDARSGSATRFRRACAEATELLSDEDHPTLAALLLTGPDTSDDAARTLQSDMGVLLQRLEQARRRPPSAGPAPVAETIARAAEMLRRSSVAQRAIYVFSDRQRISFENLRSMPELKQAGIPILLVDCSDGPASNVGIADLQITGRRVVDQALELSATLVNSSPTDKVVNVWLHVDGQAVGQPVRKVLAGAGKGPEGPAGGESRTRDVVRFRHRFTDAGTHAGQIVVEAEDDLAVDNVRRFSLRIAERVGTVLVRPASAAGGALDPAAVVQLALDPYGGASGSWSVKLTTTTDEALSAAAIGGAQVVLSADVAAFTQPQAEALVSFVRRGGTAVFFLGPAAVPESYNDLFVQRVPESGGLLPGRIGRAVGQVGLTGEAVRAVKELRHAYLANLYQTSSDYPEVLVQRYFRLAGNLAGAEAILSTPAGDPIACAKDFGAGRVVLVTTTASAEWNNLSTTALFLPMLSRICLEAGSRRGADHTYPAGRSVTIRPAGPVPEKAAVNITPPDGPEEVLPLMAGEGGPEVTFQRTDRLGLYHWSVAGAAPEDDGLRGAFAVNPDGAECDLAEVPPEAIERAA
ncbi:MAG: BatA domain-containing protein, partial [Planctomycetota bacterium]